jgi:hypothetical protein
MLYLPVDMALVADKATVPATYQPVYGARCVRKKRETDDMA